MSRITWWFEKLSQFNHEIWHLNAWINKFKSSSMNQSIAAQSYFFFERFIHCVLKMSRKFERDLNVFETFEWNVSNDDEIDFDESMFMNFQKKMRSFTFSNETKFQIDDSIEINFINEVFRNSLFSIIIENAN